MSHHWPCVLLTLLKSIMYEVDPVEQNMSHHSPCVLLTLLRSIMYEVDPVDQACLIIGPMCVTYIVKIYHVLS